MKADDIMYRRYESQNRNTQSHERERHNDTRSNHNVRQPKREYAQRHDNHRHSEHNTHNDRRHHENHSRHEHRHHNEHTHHDHHHRGKHHKNAKNPLLSFIPSSVYNPENGKILGFLSAEDLLLIAMILMFLDSEEDGDNLMVYALLYILASDWFDLDFTKFL